MEHKSNALADLALRKKREAERGLERAGYSLLFFCSQMLAIEKQSRFLLVASFANYSNRSLFFNQGSGVR